METFPFLLISDMICEFERLMYKRKRKIQAEIK